MPVVCVIQNLILTRYKRTSSVVGHWTVNGSDITEECAHFHLQLRMNNWTDEKEFDGTWHSFQRTVGVQVSQPDCLVFIVEDEWVIRNRKEKELSSLQLF